MKTLKESLHLHKFTPADSLRISAFKCCILLLGIHLRKHRRKADSSQLLQGPT